MKWSPLEKIKSLPGNNIEQKRRGEGKGDELSCHDNKKFRLDQRNDKKVIDGNPIYIGWSFRSYTPLRVTREAVLMEFEC